VTKLQLVQPLSFGDTVLCYHRKIRRLILGRYCRYLKFSQILYVGVISRIETDKISVLSINALQFATISDTSLGHKIFSHGRISALFQISVRRIGINSSSLCFSSFFLFLVYTILLFFLIRLVRVHRHDQNKK